MSVTHETPQPATNAPPAADSAIEAVDLVKTYRVRARGARGREVPALRGVSFRVPTGTILGLLGPNGAGKTTVVKILTTLASPDSGTATVAGIDVARDPARIRRIIGYVPQKASFDPNLTGRENLVLQGRIHGVPPAALADRVDEMLTRFELTEAAGRIARKWSGGMQRKLDVAMALLHRPAVLFLDEPTTGLDPEARTQLWDAITTLTASGSLAVLLTTHYLEEADHLADHLVIIDQGAVVATGTPEELKDNLAGDTIQVKLPSAENAERARGALAGVPDIERLTVAGAELRAVTGRTDATLPAVLAALEDAKVAISSITVARPSLDQVYLHHAGRSFPAVDDTRTEAEV